MADLVVAGFTGKSLVVVRCKDFLKIFGQSFPIYLSQRRYGRSPLHRLFPYLRAFPIPRCAPPVLQILACQSPWRSSLQLSMGFSSPPHSSRSGWSIFGRKINKTLALTIFSSQLGDRSASSAKWRSPAACCPQTAQASQVALYKVFCNNDDDLGFAPLVKWRPIR